MSSGLSESEIKSAIKDLTEDISFARKEALKGEGSISYTEDYYTEKENKIAELKAMLAKNNISFSEPKPKTQEEHNSALNSILSGLDVSSSDSISSSGKSVVKGMAKSAISNLANKTVEDQDKLAKEQIKLTKEQEEETEAARAEMHDANAVKGAVATPVSTKTSVAEQTALGNQPVNAESSDGAVNKTPEEAEQEKIEQAQEVQEAKDNINAEVQEKVAALKDEGDAKIESAKGGIHGILAFFASSGVFIIMAGIDSIISGTIPVVGDVIAAVMLFIFWSIPALLTFDVALWTRIAMFIAIDWAVGTFGGTLANFIPVVGDILVDWIPEMYVLKRKKSIPHLIRKTYFDKLPALIAKIKEQYKIKIAEVKAEGKDKLKFALKKLQGHFGGVAVEGRKVVFLCLVVIIGFLSQVGGLFGLGSTQEAISIVVALLVIFAIKAIGFIGMKEFEGLAFFLGFNVLFKYILQADGLLTKYIGSGNSLVVTIVFIVFSLLLMFRIANPQMMSSQRMAGIAAIILLLIITPFMFGYVTSDRFTTDIQHQAVEKEAQLDNLNLVERMLLWVEEMQTRGSGDYIPAASQENVHEFIGVTLGSIEPTRESFLEGRPVQLNIFYSTGSKEPKYVRTSCQTKGIRGVIIPDKVISLTELYSPTVKCAFEELPKGSHKIQVMSFYDDSSEIEIPLMFMSELKYEQILKEKGDPATFEGGVPQPVTSSGPIDFKIRNVGKEDSSPIKFKTPLVLDPDNLNEFPHLITLQLSNPLGDSRTQGQLVSVKRVIFDLPEGLHLGACDFQNNVDETLLYNQEGSRWIVDITEHFNTAEPYESFSCNMYVNPAQLDRFIPPNTAYSIATMRYTIDYTYKLEKEAIVKVT